MNPIKYKEKKCFKTYKQQSTWERWNLKIGSPFKIGRFQNYLKINTSYTRYSADRTNTRD